MFKRGSQYSRDEIANLVRPDKPPYGGDWATGYARIDDKLFVFMNIGVAGRTGHDFENYYDEKTNTLIWFSKPKKQSTNPLFQKLISGELTPYFFARWNQKPPFTFLGTGSILKFEDGYGDTLVGLTTTSLYGDTGKDAHLPLPVKSAVSEKVKTGRAGKSGESTFASFSVRHYEVDVTDFLHGSCAAEPFVIADVGAFTCN